MTNAVIDALSWNPDNPAASVRALQTALMTLQEEWAALIPPLGQISRNGRVYENDWNIFEADRADATFLHFDNETPDFRGEWGNIDGIVQPIEAIARPGASELFPITFARTVFASTTGTVLTGTFTLTRPAKLYIYLPIMIDIISGSLSSIALRLGGVTQFTWVPFGITTVWKPWYVAHLLDEQAAGTYTIDLRATTVGGSTEFSPLAPLPNVTNAVTLGVFTPTLAYVEAIYQ